MFLDFKNYEKKVSRVLFQVQFASEAGAVGVILFSDPNDFAPEGRKSVYPETIRMPGMATQSGSVLLGYGDPLTPLYPALGKWFCLSLSHVVELIWILIKMEHSGCRKQRLRCLKFLSNPSDTTRQKSFLGIRKYPFIL